MLQKTVSKTVCIHFRTNTRLNIVVHLDIADTVVPYHTVDDFGHMLNHKRMTEIQLITASVIHTLAVAQEEALIRQNGSLLTVDTHNLQLQPDTRNHALRTNIIRHLTHSIRKALLLSCHSPTLSHQLPSAYQPASMTKYSHPAFSAASTSGNSFSVVGSPNRQFI